MAEPNTQEASSLTFDLEKDILSYEDALKCLTGQEDMIIPMPNMRACNNLDEYFMKSTSRLDRASQANHNQSPSTSSNDSTGANKSSFKEPFAVPLVRNFDKILKKTVDKDGQESASPALIEKVRRSRPDVFSRTEQLSSTSGPLIVLKQRLGHTVKVLIRRRRKVPYISRTIEYKGELHLFDKHMNLYLRDVIESFIYTRDDKVLKRARHRDSILLRGDNIILVS